eukprot:8262926-Lingulodinium_polyedra.AAC.1
MVPPPPSCTEPLGSIGGGDGEVQAYRAESVRPLQLPHHQQAASRGLLGRTFMPPRRVEAATAISGGPSSTWAPLAAARRS